eukprot:CAMPEP_0172402966 /NCGR_PEP_ID=MMETSP1061-20121228/57067_1 /TAXON_ID=37318 /ORGANISM="Pseudo-nitzschia pungens, Strain cf. pungens" /LENGTH=38 /DNA_ID= /DNA_START= /DNA_END= /DNA_ORIENTATION=
MPYNTNSKVNPFFIQDHEDEEDPWEDEDYDDDDNDDDE